MTKVFVHGNPETAAIWRPMFAALAERGVTDTATVSPPGFGAPLPDGFGATAPEYVEWLAAELSAMSGPIDLVGHDWGAGHVAGLAATHPGLIRSWAIDCAGLINPDYVWHDAAQAWRTPGAGEEHINSMLGLPTADLAGAFEGLGMKPDIALEVAGAANEDMKTAVLALYRSAGPTELSALATRLESAERRPSLLLSALDDPYVSAELAPAVADRMGSTIAELPGQSHWWMMDPATAANALVAFWNALD